MSNGKSAHGTLIARNGITIGELKAITPPALTRKAIEITNQNDSDDSYVVGVRRKGEMSFDVNFLPSGDTTHAQASGLISAWSSGTNDRYNISFVDGANWMFSGYVINIQPKAPVDDAFEATVTVRPSGTHTMTP